MAIPPRVSLATLGARDVATSTAFYRALGWPLSPASVEGEVSFFDTAGGLLGVFGRSALAADAHVPDDELHGFRGCSLAINLESEALVDAAFADVRAAGGTVVKEPEKVFWGGYSGYFADPDGHLWEIAHNPGWPIGDDGRPHLPAGRPADTGP
ncbi:MAG: VOC family protein [Candidatus Dormibacteraeota bacterium]|nr:VOC family protein [Candidatus Dormibacteraeota bacterium]